MHKRLSATQGKQHFFIIFSGLDRYIFGCGRTKNRPLSTADRKKTLQEAKPQDYELSGRPPRITSDLSPTLLNLALWPSQLLLSSITRQFQHAYGYPETRTW